MRIFRRKEAGNRQLLYARLSMGDFGLKKFVANCWLVVRGKYDFYDRGRDFKAA